jgi:hypothetical protein
MKSQLTLSEMHERVTQANNLLHEFALPNDEVDSFITGPDRDHEIFNVEITNLFGDEDPQKLEAFKQHWIKTQQLTRDLDTMFHDLWDCQ